VAAVLVVLVVAVVVVVAVLGAAGRAQRRPRLEGRSIYRGPRSHENVDGRAKVAYATLEDARRAALAQGARTGRPMTAYPCRDPRCGAFHIGHG
jgi:hypothetical protein